MVDEEGLALWALGADGRAVKVQYINITKSELECDLQLYGTASDLSIPVSYLIPPPFKTGAGQRPAGGGAALIGIGGRKNGGRAGLCVGPPRPQQDRCGAGAGARAVGPPDVQVRS